MRLRIKRILVATLLLWLTLAVVGSASAAEPESGSISALFLVDDKPVQDVRILALRVAALDDDCGFEWFDSYAKYHLSTNIQDNASAASLAQTLASYVSRDSVKEDVAAKTDANGSVLFGQLPMGVYLITGETTTIGRYTYKIVPTLVFIPHLIQNGETETHAAIELKHESVYNPPDTPHPQTAIRKVLKVWDLAFGNYSREPISVNLLRNGRVYDTKTLSEDNNWTYTWRGLDDNCFWSLVEESVPDGFVTTVSRQGVTFVVTNSEETPPDILPVPSKPNPPATPTETVPDPAVPADPGPQTPTNPNSPTKPKLPQTGMLLWPIAILCAAGISTGIGASLFKKKNLLRLSYITLGFSLASILGACLLLGISFHNDQTAGEDSEVIVGELLSEIPDIQADEFSIGEEIVPNYVLDASMDMPEIVIDGGSYIGVIEIPVLDLTLPVQAEWSTKGAAKAPCRYVGSVYNGDCIIAAHNFKSHFGRIGSLVADDEVIFADVEGNEFHYAVSGTETLDGTDIDGMKAGEWDLTLFTCTPGGRQRVAVRCQQMSPEENGD